MCDDFATCWAQLCAQSEVEAQKTAPGPAESSAETQHLAGRVGLQRLQQECGEGSVRTMQLQGQRLRPMCGASGKDAADFGGRKGLTDQLLLDQGRDYVKCVMPNRSGRSSP